MYPCLLLSTFLRSAPAEENFSGENNHDKEETSCLIHDRDDVLKG